MQQDLNISKQHDAALSAAGTDTSDQIKPCCKETIEEHITHNKMMVCGQCKMLIKCYENKGPFENYLKFCNSRKRTTYTGFYANHHTVVFNPYSHL